MTAHPDPECPQHGQATNDDHVYNCTKDWPDPRCAQHSGTACTCMSASHEDPGCPHHISPALADLVSGCPLHQGNCPRDANCSWWEARRTGAPWFGPVGQPRPPRIVPSPDGASWIVQGVTEHDTPFDLSPSDYEQAVALDVAAKLRKIAEHWVQAANRAGTKLVAEPSGTDRRRLYAVQVVTYTETYQRLEREAVALETGQDFEDEL